MDKIFFDNIMFGYAAEDCITGKIKVTMPDMFPDKPQGEAITYQTSTGLSKKVIINSNRPAIANFVTNHNYIELPRLSSVGKVELNDKLIVGFVGNSPVNGVVLGKVR